MAFIIFHSHFVHAAFVSSLVYQTFDRIILGRMSFPGTRCFEGGTRWKNRTHKWCAIRKVWEPLFYAHQSPGAVVSLLLRSLHQCFSYLTVTNWSCHSQDVKDVIRHIMQIKIKLWVFC